MNAFRRELLMTGIVYDTFVSNIRIPDEFHNSFKRATGDSPEYHALSMVSAYCNLIYVPLGVVSMTVDVDQWTVEVKVLKHTPKETVAVVGRFLVGADTITLHGGYSVRRLVGQYPHNGIEYHDITGVREFGDLQDDKEMRGLVGRMLEDLYPD